MLQSLLLILVIIGLLWGIAHLKRLPPKERRKLFLRSAIGGLIIALIMMAITGRMHWLFALIGALIPFMRGLLGIGMQILPFWLKRKANEQQTKGEQHERQAARPTSDMTIKEAADILGLSSDLTHGEINAEKVNDVHRRLIQKLHPDRGGNDYLAAKINQARDVLLQQLKK